MRKRASSVFAPELVVLNLGLASSPRLGGDWAWGSSSGWLAPNLAGRSACPAKNQSLAQKDALAWRLAARAKIAAGDSKIQESIQTFLRRGKKGSLRD